MVEESELISRLRQIISTSDLNTTSAGAVRRQLESDLGLDLSLRKKFISKLIDDIIQEHQHKDEDDVANDNDEHNNDQHQDKDDAVNDNDEHNNAINGQSEEVDEEDTDDKASDTESLEPAKKKRGGFTKVCSLSPVLEDFLGVSEMARTEVVKKLWAYIKENDLQDPSNRRNIKCDDKLHPIFRVNSINMFQMNKVLSKHIWPLETDDECSVSRPEMKQKRPKEEDNTECSSSRPKKKQKRQKEEADADMEKPKATGFLKPLQLSEAFVNFLGTGETTLSRAEAVKRMWGYIKENGLQDPSDKRRILCDEKLKELFEVDTFNGFTVTKYLKAHLSKVEEQ